MEKTLRVNVRTDSMEILNILCLEDELKLGKYNAYKTERMSFLLKVIGFNNALSITDEVYRKYLTALVCNNYVITTSMTNGYSVANFEAFLRKIQKQLQIVYLLNVYNPILESGRRVSHMDEYDILFGKVDMDNILKSAIDTAMYHLRISIASADAYNKVIDEINGVMTLVLDEFKSTADDDQKVDIIYRVLNSIESVINSEKMIKYSCHHNHRKYANSQTANFSYTKKGELYLKVRNNIILILQKRGIRIKWPVLDVSCLESYRQLICDNKMIFSDFESYLSCVGELFTPYTTKDEVNALEETKSIFRKKIAILNRCYRYERYKITD